MPDYLIFGDLHLSDRPPSSCTDTYLDDLLDLLAAISDIALHRGSSGVICAGDFFHHKTPGRTSHRTILRTIDVLRAFPCPVYVVPGNHDLLQDRLDSVDDTQPLGVVIASGALTLLNGWMTGTRFHPVYGVPWLQHFTDHTVEGALHGYRDFLDHQPDYGPTLVVTHAPLYPPGRELVHEYFPTSRWAQAMASTGSVYYGHVHEPHGIYTVNGVTFANAGALSRGSLHEHNLTRPIQIAAWSPDTGLFELVDVPHKPAADVFRLAQAAEIRTAKVQLSQFLASVDNTQLDITSIETVMTYVRDLNLDPVIESTILTLLEEAA